MGAILPPEHRRQRYRAATPGPRLGGRAASVRRGGSVTDARGSLGPPAADHRRRRAARRPPAPAAGRPRPSCPTGTPSASCGWPAPWSSPSLGIVLSTLRWRQVLAALGLRAPAAHPLLPLPGRPVRRQLPALDHRRRRAAGHPASASQRRPPGHLRLGGARAADRLARAARCSPWRAMAVNPGLRELGTGQRRRRRAVGAARWSSWPASWSPPASPRLGGRLAGSEGWRRFVGAVHLGLDRFRHHPGAAVEVLARRLAYQLAVVAGRLPRRPGPRPRRVGPTAVLAFMPAVAIAQVLPISLGGLGVREGAFVLFLGPLGVPAGQAVALGLLVYGLNLAVSLLGAPSFAVGGGTGRSGARLRDRARRRRRRPGRVPCRDPARPPVTLRWWREACYILAFYLVYSVIRNQFGSAAVRPGRRLRQRRARHRHRAAALGSFHEETDPGVVPRRPWLHPVLEPLLRHLPLRGHHGRHRLPLPPAALALRAAGAPPWPSPPPSP